MVVRVIFGILLLVLCQTNTWAAGSVFDGTWRAAYPQRFDPQRMPDDPNNEEDTVLQVEATHCPCQMAGPIIYGDAR
jgi:hypothetical protein